MNLPKEVFICEVGLRDGLQNESKILDVNQKVSVANTLIQAGFRYIELGSFVHPRAVPQMSDTDQVYRQLVFPKGVEGRALVANLKGLERAISCGCKKIKLNVSASKTHNLKNLNKLPSESVKDFSEIFCLASENSIFVSGSISMAFGSPWERISYEDLCPIIDSYINLGIDEISVSDTSGMAVPDQVYRYSSKLKAKYPEVCWWFHFHNTRGAAMSNVIAAMQAGMNHFDTSIAGLGGCPFVPGAAGNLASEDLLYILGRMNIETHVQYDLVLKAAKEMMELLQHPSDSYMLRIGEELMDVSREGGNQV